MASAAGDQPRSRPIFNSMRRKWLMGLAAVGLLVTVSIVWAQSYRNTGAGTTKNHCKKPALRACLPASAADNASAKSSSLRQRSAAPWFYMRSRRKGHCLQWNADLVCLGWSLLHFRTPAFCSSYCEKDDPRPRCTQPIDSGMLHCSNEEYHEGRRTMWWFYDSYQKACVKWEHVCLENTYDSLRTCATECLS